MFITIKEEGTAILPRENTIGKNTPSLPKKFKAEGLMTPAAFLQVPLEASKSMVINI